MYTYTYCNIVALIDIRINPDNLLAG